MKPIDGCQLRHVRAVRVARGMSQKAVAERAGVATTAFSFIERGLPADPAIAERIAAALMVEVETLTAERLVLTDAGPVHA